MLFLVSKGLVFSPFKLMPRSSVNPDIKFKKRRIVYGCAEMDPDKRPTDELFILIGRKSKYFDGLCPNWSYHWA